MTTTRNDASAWTSIERRAEGDSARLTPLLSVVDLSPEMIAVALRASGVLRSAVWGPAEDAVAVGWRTTEGEDEDTDVGADLDARLDIEGVITQARGEARAEGCAWLLPLTMDDGDLSTPLPDGPRDLSVVHVVPRADVTVREWERRAGSPRWGRGVLYNVTLSSPGTSAQYVVHESRLIYVPGLRRTQAAAESDDCWHESATALYWPIVRDLEVAWASTADGIFRRGAPQLKVDHNLVGVSDFAEAFRTRVRTFARMLSHYGLVVLGLNDELTWTAPPLSGTSEVFEALYTRLTAVETRPLSKFFGTPPGGLSTDDASGQRTYDALLEREQRTLTPVLQAIYAQAFGSDDTRRIVWSPLGQPTAAERAATGLVLAQRDAILVQIGAIADAEVRERFRGETEVDLPPLDPAYDIVPGDKLQAPEDVEPAAVVPDGPPLP